MREFSFYYEYKDKNRDGQLVTRRTLVGIKRCVCPSRTNLWKALQLKFNQCDWIDTVGYHTDESI